MKKLAWMVLKPLFQLLRPSFAFSGGKYAYFWHPYNMTWRGERAIEIPIVKKIVDGNRNKRILEIGNVLSHYFEFPHDIVDKYEKAPNVMNRDVVTFRPQKAAYDLILSISTLEHVGWDEKPRDSKKFLKAFKNLMGPCLKPGGMLIVTLPLGHNPVLDKAIAENQIRFTQKYYLKRIGRINHWKESDQESVKNCKEMDPYPFANGLFVGIFHKIKK